MKLSKDISCIFNRDAHLLLSLDFDGNILIETDDTDDEISVFHRPFIIDKDSHLHPFFDYFLLSNHETPDVDFNLKPVLSRPDATFNQKTGHGNSSTLSLYFTKTNLIGVHAGTPSPSISNPIVWLSPAGEITRQLISSIDARP